MRLERQTLKVLWEKLTFALQEELVWKLAEHAMSYGYSFAFYRLPASLRKSVTTKRDVERLVFIFAAEDLKTARVGDWRRYGSGQEAFVFSPFSMGKVRKEQFYDFTLTFLQPDVIWDTRKGTLELSENRKQANAIKIFSQQLRALVEGTLSGDGTRREQKVSWYRLDQKVRSTPLKLFLTRAKKALRVLEQEKVSKLVLSCVRYLPYAKQTANKQKAGAKSRVKHAIDEFQVITTLMRALHHKDYDEAMVCLFSSPSVGTWLTVSPEILVSQVGQYFRTISLAGTKKISQGGLSGVEGLRTVGWRDKDICEQAMVSRYIVDCFKLLRLRAYRELGPQTVQRGELLHLQTEFLVDCKEVYGDELFLDMLALLHPTSAVAGEPLRQALALIELLEEHERQYYTGFLGPVRIGGLSALYVNLRCAQWLSSGLVTYGGAGMIKASDARSEWQEIQAKLDVIPNIILE